MPHALAETITHSPSESEDVAAVRADALRAESWAGEPFLRPDEDPDVVLAMREAGAHTIAQDEGTSVIYGMPREAVLLGAAERVLPLGEIGALLARLTARVN